MACANSSKGVVVLRSQLPEINGRLDFDRETNTCKAVGVVKRENPELVLSPLVFSIGTEMIGGDRQREIYEGTAEGYEDDSGDDSDDDKEMIDETFKVFVRFSKESPGHVMRYSFSKKTKPLFYSDYNQFDFPCKEKCSNCGGPLSFEFQLNAQLLSVVKELIDLDWGIVTVFTCVQSCKGEDYIEEHVEIQLGPEEIDKMNWKKMNDRKMKEFEKDMLDNDEIPMEMLKKLEKQIKEQEASFKTKKSSNKQTNTIQKKDGQNKHESVMEEKPGKLFEQEGDDDWN